MREMKGGKIRVAIVLAPCLLYLFKLGSQLQSNWTYTSLHGFLELLFFNFSSLRIVATLRVLHYLLFSSLPFTIVPLLIIFNTQPECVICFLLGSLTHMYFVGWHLTRPTQDYCVHLFKSTCDSLIAL